MFGHEEVIQALFPSTHLFPSPVTMTSSPSQQITCQEGMEMLGIMCLGVVVYQLGMSINHLYSSL